MKRAFGAIFLQNIVEAVFVSGCVSQSGQDKGTTYEKSLEVGDVVTNYEL